MHNCKHELCAQEEGECDAPSIRFRAGDLARRIAALWVQWAEIHQGAIERDGAPVLQTEYGVSDGLDPAAIWRGLQGDSFDAVGTVTPAVDDPQKAVLKGKIRIVILHVNNEIAAAKVNELRLTRASGSGNQWKLASGEVDRTARLRDCRLVSGAMAKP